MASEHTVVGQGESEAAYRQRPLRLVVLGFLMASLLAVTLPVGEPAVAAGCSAQAGHCAPDFTLTDWQGHRVRLSAYRGRAVVINFFGVPCTYCRQELPALVGFAAAFTRRRGVVLGVDTWGDDPGSVASYARANHIRWTLLPDPPTTVGNLYGVSGTPTNVFVDRHGIIRTITYGPLSRSQFEKYARGLS
jgi:peroxiredoxin